MSIKLRTAPSFRVGRAQSGSLVVDSSALTLANYPLDTVLFPRNTDDVVFYWTQIGGSASDTVGVQVILLDANNNLYVAGPTTTIVASKLSTVKTYGCPFYLRVASIPTPGGTDLRIFVAAAPPPARRDMVAAGNPLRLRARTFTSSLGIPRRQVIAPGRNDLNVAALCAITSCKETGCGNTSTCDGWTDCGDTLCGNQYTDCGITSCGRTGCGASEPCGGTDCGDTCGPETCGPDTCPPPFTIATPTPRPKPQLP